LTCLSSRESFVETPVSRILRSGASERLVAKRSSVASTAPKVEFSKGTTPWSAVPSWTAAKTAAMVGQGRSVFDELVKDCAAA